MGKSTSGAGAEHAYHTPHHVSRELEHSSTEEATRLEQLKRDPILKAPSASRPWMDMLMRRELDRLVLIANGGTTSFEPKITRPSEDHDPLRDRALIAADKIVLKWDSAENHWRRLNLLAGVQTLTRSVRFAPDRSLIAGTKEWRQKIAADSRSLRHCAHVYGVSHSTVARIRKEFPQRV